MPGWVEFGFCEPAKQRPVTAVLQAFEVPAHVVRVPTGILCQLLNVLPILVVGVNQNLGVVGGASTQGAGTRIENSINSLAIVLADELPIPLVLGDIRVVVDKKVPFHALVFRSKSMKCRHVIGEGQT